MGAWPPRSLAGMFDLSRESGQKAQADPDLGWQEGYGGAALFYITNGKKGYMHWWVTSFFHLIQPALPSL